MLNKIAFTIGMINMMANASAEHQAAANGNAARAAADQVQLIGDYVQYASQYGKHYYTTSEFNDHKSSYESNDDYIRRCNEKADASGDADAVHCAHNQFSDMNDDEFEAAISGLPPMGSEELEAGRHLQEEDEEEDLLDDDLPDKVNHRKWMGPVKSQGGCGSCAAFSATSVLEASIAKKMRNKDYSQRISEQHLVDCTMNTEKTRELFGDNPSYGYNLGCDGGWMHNHWEFQKEHGAVRYEDYPYNARENECNHENVPIYGNVASYKKFHGRRDLKTMMRETKKHPVSVAVHASAKNFRFYKSGVVKNCCDKDLDPNCDDMDRPINHAVTVWGYKVYENKNGRTKGVWRIQNSWGSNWGQDGMIKLDLLGDKDGVCNINRYGVWSVKFDLESMDDLPDVDSDDEDSDSNDDLETEDI